MTGDEPGKPEVELPPVEGSPIPIANCADLAAALNTPFTDADSADCKAGQSQGTVCGCPIPDGACFLCGSADMMIDPSMALKELPFLATDLLESENTLDGNMTCVTMDSLMNTWKSDEEQCTTVSGQVAEMCGCMEKTMSETESIDDEPEKESTDTTNSGAKATISVGLAGWFAMMLLNY